MKIAVTAHGNTHLAKIDSRFNLAEYFILYDQIKDTWSNLVNARDSDPVYRAKILSENGIKVLITGYIGVRAFRLLQSQNITIFSSRETNSTVKEILSAFQFGKLAILYAPNAIEIQKRK
ncbi:MAG: NifB/NifX family molybdenum-iron cluster-binding protein [Veillonellales bacterium]